MKRHYDLLLVGGGLFNGVVAHEAIKRKKSVLVVERRPHIGGNCYTEKIEGIDVHAYGAHIFRTSDKDIWEYFRSFGEMNHFINSPIANYRGEIYNMPFNMNTFNKMWGVVTPAEAQEIISRQSASISDPQANLENHVISMVGVDVYEKLVKGYTEKQWGAPCSELPASLIRRLPVRFTYNNNYFNDAYQGIPLEGYTSLLQRMYAGCDIKFKIDYLNFDHELGSIADQTVYTGAIDEFYSYCFGCLEWRSLRFETQVFQEENKQGVAVVNYTDSETPYTRTIEHKHFTFGTQPSTVVTYEYPAPWEKGLEPFYPMEDQQNQLRYKRYAELANQDNRIRFGGRLGEYRYYDMQDTIKSALTLCQELFSDE